MVGLKEAALVGATAVLAGGAAYLVWVSASSAWDKRTEEQPMEGGEKREARKEGKKEKKLFEAVAAPVAAAAAPQTAEVRRGPKWTHRPGDMDRNAK